MIEVLIKYIPDKGYYGVYEPTTDTLMASSNISEALISLSNFLKDSGMITGDILSSNEISYHLDSHTMKAMVESNVNLMKRLNNAPSGFMISSQKFGSSINSQNKKDNNAGGDSKFGNKNFGGKQKSGFSSFSGNSNFGTSFKKFGWKG